MRYKSEVKVGGVTRENYDRYTARQLRHLADTNPDLKDSIEEYIRKIMSSYSYNPDQNNSKSLEQIKRDLLLSLAFPEFGGTYYILEFKPELFDAVLVSEEFIFSDTLTKQEFTATCHLKLCHLVAMAGRYNLFDLIDRTLRNVGKSGDQIRSYFSQPLEWGVNNVRGQRGPTPLFIVILLGHSELTAVFVNSYYKLIPDNGFDIPFFTDINPYILVLLQNEFERYNPFLGIKEVDHPFSMLKHIESEQTQGFRRSALEYSFEKALVEDDTLLLERVINGDDPNQPRFSSLVENISSDEPSVLMRAMVHNRMDLVMLLTKHLSSRPNTLNERETEVVVAVRNAVELKNDNYVPFVQHLLKCRFLTKDHKRSIKDLIGASIITFSNKKETAIKESLRKIVKVAMHVQNAILFSVDNGYALYFETPKKGFSAFDALRKAAAIDRDFFNDLIITHFSQGGCRLNRYLETRPDLDKYLNLLMEFHKLEPDAFKLKTLSQMADEYVYLAHHEKTDFGKGVNYQLALQFYGLVVDNGYDIDLHNAARDKIQKITQEMDNTRAEDTVECKMQ